jgi:histidine phosphotransferase ChpT
VVQYRLAHPQNLNRLDVQSAFLLLVRLESALLFGGRIAAQLHDKGWHITGQSEKLRFFALY